jgi:curved DNA-binding protein CbpA
MKLKNILCFVFFLCNFGFVASSQLENRLKPDYYKILGLTNVATVADIKKSYRELALKYHPDKNKSEGAEDTFKEIGMAYRVLSDSASRHLYDCFYQGVQSSSQYSMNQSSTFKPKHEKTKNTASRSYHFEFDEGVEFPAGWGTYSGEGKDGWRDKLGVWHEMPPRASCNSDDEFDEKDYQRNTINPCFGVHFAPSMSESKKKRYDKAFDEQKNKKYE